MVPLGGTPSPQFISASTRSVKRPGSEDRAFSFSLSLEGEDRGEGEMRCNRNGFLPGDALTLTLSQRERGLYPRMKRPWERGFAFSRGMAAVW